MVDILYPAKKLRHEFAKVLHNAYCDASRIPKHEVFDEVGGYAIKRGGVPTAILGTALVGGGLAMQEPPETLLPDTDAAPQAVQLTESFKSEIRSLAEDRAAFLAMKQGSAFTSDEEFLTVKQTGNEMGLRAERLVGRIVMSDALSETQAAELLTKFSNRVTPITDMGFAESSFGYLRESRTAVQENPRTDWMNISKEITRLAAEQEAAVNKRIRMGIVEKICITMLMIVPLAVAGSIGGLLVFLGTIGAGSTRTVRRWAEEKPKKPFLGH